MHRQFANLSLPFADDKAVLLASSDDLAQDIFRRLGPKAGEIRRQAKSLGLDLTLRKIKAKKVQGERLKEFGRRIRRLKIIKRKSAPAQRIFFGGILPAVWYGVELVGMADSTLKKLTTAALRMLGADIKGAVHDITWAALGERQDPRCEVALASLRRYHREWWITTGPTKPSDVLTPPQLVQAFTAVEAHKALRQDGRTRPNGPIAQLHRAAACAGWTFLNATTIRTHDGQVDLVKTSPAAMERIFRLHYRHHLDARATKAIRGDIMNFDAHGRPEVLHFHAVRQLRQHYLRTKQYAPARDLLRPVTGTIWTPARVKSVFGHDTACTMCGQENANARHILFDCPALSMDREHFFNSQNLQMQEEDWDQPHLDKGLFVVPRSLRAAPRAGVTEVFGPSVPTPEAGSTFFEPGKPIYLDESAFFADDPNFARAGMAALQHTDGRITASWSSPVPAPFAATAAVGAQMAAARCTQLSCRPHLVVDCSAIVANATKPWHACYYKNPAAGFGAS